ncbi:unnamed protein product [Polarella glacialis]|uniref:Zeta toxin domain-containing protein n=1 Tax=Polarella glacialis TaxID=89957 RepID=A0A813FWA4_POLGL|nr:unnamed protein product [Polarella glacialis]
MHAAIAAVWLAQLSCFLAADTEHQDTACMMQHQQLFMHAPPIMKRPSMILAEVDRGTGGLAYGSPRQNSLEDPQKARSCSHENLKSGWNTSAWDALKASFTSEGSMSKSRSFYIAYGPPASGKSSVVKKSLSYFGSNDSLVPIVVDSIVEGIPGYLAEKAKCDSFQEMQDLYWSCRKSKAKGGLGADELSDDILATALREGKSVRWETTGATVAWTVREAMRIRRLGYKVIVVYLFVEAQELVVRSLRRQHSTGQLAAPKEQILGAAGLAAKNIQHLLGFTDEVHLWDNNGPYKKEKLILAVQNVFDWTPEDRVSEEQAAHGAIFVGPGHFHLPSCGCDVLGGGPDKDRKTMKELANDRDAGGVDLLPWVENMCPKC